MNKKGEQDGTDQENSNQLEHFWEIFEGDFEMAVEISTMFCTYIPELFKEIESAIAVNNNVAIQKLLHKLKGSIGYLGFIAECNIVAEHEIYFKEHGLQDASVKLEPIQTRLFALVDLVRKEVLEKQ